MPITGGSVTYGRTVQPAQYESKKAEVTITFAVEDSASDEAVEAIKSKAATMAQSTALELVGMTAEAKPATTRRTAAAKTAETPDTSKADAQKAAAAAKLNAAVKCIASSKANISTGEERKDPAQATDPDGLDDDLLGEPEATTQPTGAKEYSDKDLTDTVSRVNGVIKDPGKIKAVRSKYTTGAIATIAKDKRAAFVAEIEALLPAK